MKPEHRQELEMLLATVARTIAAIHCPDCRVLAERLVIGEIPKFVREGVLVGGYTPEQKCEQHTGT